jgi:hypothetical protein
MVIHIEFRYSRRMTPSRRSNPDPRQQLRDNVVRALRERGYRARRQSQLDGYQEYRSPSRRAGNPLVRMRHSVFVAEDGGVCALREGARIDYMVELPERMVEVILGR